MRRILKIIAGVSILIQINIPAQVGGIDGVAKGEIKDLNFDKDYGIDLYTGTININIPLEKIKQDNLSLDLALSYDATGVLVNNISGIVGQNWNLSAGGSITRKVKGMCFDELNYDNVTIPQPGVTGGMSHQTGFFEARILLNRNDWKDLTHMRRILLRAVVASHLWPPEGPPYHEIDFGDGLPNFKKVFKIDTEPDIFYFNFFGKSGYFFMGEDGKWKVSSKENLKVIDYNSETDLINPTEGLIVRGKEMPPYYQRKSLGKITLVDDNGYQYIFGDNDVKSMDINLGSYYDSDILSPYSTKWNLKKVINPNGKVLFSFTYTTGQYFLTNLYTESPLVTSSSVATQNPSAGYSQNPLNISNFFHIYRESGYFYKPSYLSKITTSDGTTVDFSYIEKNNMLYTHSENNLLYPNEYNLFNRFWNNLILGYLNNEDIPYSNGGKNTRYILDNIKVNFLNKLVNNFDFQYANADPRVFLYQISKNNDEKHHFFYDDPNNLPGYLSEKTDMWGYYNGQPTSVSYSTRFNFWQNFENNKYSTRGAVTSRMLKGSLKQIVWPTGGSTYFVFEPHSFGNRVTNQKSINNYVLTEPFPNGGGGLRIKKIINEGKEREFFYNNSFDDIDNNISSGILLYEPLFFQQHPVYELNMPNAGGIVAEGYIIEPAGTSSASGINPKSDFFSSNVAYSNVFEKSNDGYIKYSFNDFNDSPDYYMEERMRPFSKLSKKVDMSFERGQIKSKSYFDSNQKIILEKNYFYKNISNLTSKAIDYNYFTSDWEHYALADPLPLSMYYTIPQPACLACNSKMDPYYIYYSDKVVETELTTEYFKNGRKVESLKRYYYQSPLDISYSLIDKIEEYPNRFDLSKFKTTRYQYAVDMDTSEPIIQDLIDKNMVGIPLAVTNFNEAQEPISRVETIYAKNATTNNLTLPISVRNIKTGMYDYGSDLTTASKISLNVYDARENLLQYTDESGLPTTFIYGYNRSQPIAKVVGADYNYVSSKVNIESLQDASDVDIDQASENLLISLLDDLRKNADLKNYQITTYTYDPLVGVTSVTPPDGIRERYIYNPQNKLEKVVDGQGNPLEEYQYHYKSN